MNYTNYQLEQRPEEIAWCLNEAERGGPGPWSRTHLTRDSGLHTLCGLKIPLSFDYADRGTKLCKRCQKRDR